MGLFRSVLVWVCCVAVLVAGTPAYGLVWCRTSDGAVNLELAAADGRCDHAVPSADEDGAVEPSARLASPPCDDERVEDGVRHTAPNPVEAPQVTLTFSPLPSSFCVLVPTTGLARPTPSIPTRAAHHDAAFVRETVVILV